MVFVLSRHGKSSHNHHNIFAGCKINSKLTPVGRKNTLSLAKKISDIYEFQIIICSHLTRSYQTALIHQKAQQQKYGIKPKIIRTSLLKEVDIGQISGLNPKQAELNYPKDFQKIQSNNINDWSFTQGENPNLLNNRFIQLIKIFKQYSDKNTLIVGHAMINQVIIQKTKTKDKDYSFDHDSYLELTLS